MASEGLKQSGEDGAWDASAFRFGVGEGLAIEGARRNGLSGFAPINDSGLGLTGG
jgi:hypothetical protein